MAKQFFIQVLFDYDNDFFIKVEQFLMRLRQKLNNVFTNNKLQTSRLQILFDWSISLFPWKAYLFSEISWLVFWKCIKNSAHKISPQILLPLLWFFDVGPLDGIHLLSIDEKILIKGIIFLNV